MPKEFKLKPKHRDHALSLLKDLKGKDVHIVNKVTESAIKMKGDGSIIGEGGLGPGATWTVTKGADKMEYNGEKWPVVCFTNKKHGKCLCIKKGEICTDDEDDGCHFLVVKEDKAVILIKAKNHKCKVAFNADASCEDPKNVSSENKAKFFIFDSEKLGNMVED